MNLYIYLQQAGVDCECYSSCWCFFVLLHSFTAHSHDLPTSSSVQCLLLLCLFIFLYFSKSFPLLFYYIYTFLTVMGQWLRTCLWPYFFFNINMYSTMLHRHLNPNQLVTELLGNVHLFHSISGSRYYGNQNQWINTFYVIDNIGCDKVNICDSKQYINSSVVLEMSFSQKLIQNHEWNKPIITLLTRFCV